MQHTLEALKRFFSSLFNPILSPLHAFFASYPRIVDEPTLCAYYRRCNKHAALSFFMFIVCCAAVQVVRFIQTFIGSEPWAYCRKMLTIWFFMDIIFVIGVFGYYHVYRVAKTQKGNMARQVGARRLLHIYALVPTLVFSQFPAVLPHMGNVTELAALIWTTFCILQIQLGLWFVDGLAYKIGYMAVFNALFCRSAVQWGFFDSFNVSKFTFPVVFSLSFFVFFDRQNKLTFLLKQSIKKQKNMYERHLENVQDPVVIFCRDALLFGNKAAREKIATTLPELMDKADYIVSEHGESLSQEIKQILSAPDLHPDTVTKKKYFMSDANSELIACSRTLSITTAESQSSTDRKLLSLAFHDVTEELHQAQTRAEEKFKNMMLFSLSHELRTPLNIFQAFLAGFKKHATSPEDLAMYKNAKGAWQYLRNKISDILDYVQILSHEFVVHQSPFSVRNLVRRLRKATHCLLADKRDRVRLAFSVDPRVRDSLRGDQDRLEQVLFNLLSNAVKFTARGCISLRVKPARGKSCEEVVFEVTDTGCGMDSEVVGTLFLLRQEHDSLVVSPKLKSTGLSGLGLTVSKMICNRMGADIRVISTLGKGSTFSFSLPAECLDPPMPRSSSQDFNTVPDEGVHANSCLKSVGVSKTQHNKALTTVRKDRTRVLVVDDNELNRHVVKCMVNKLGFTTVEAGNGKEAVSKVADISKRGETLVVFMDLDMPVMDGIEATIEIRKNGGPRPYIIALTAFASEAERSKCMEVGMDGFISKPLTKESLVDAFKHIGLIE
ncbi:MAG: response regulator [Candidatus Pacebacteria bacterium]|nr:response regulator [Candidatus Paceibacterota bacterium]